MRAHASASESGSWWISPIPSRRQTDGKSFGLSAHVFRANCTVHTNGIAGTTSPAAAQHAVSTRRSNGALWAARNVAPSSTGASFGQASGDIGAYEIGRLAQKSITLSRPNYGHYCDTPEKLRAQIERLFAAIEGGMIKLSPPRRYRLADARQAHADLEARRTTGSLILVP